MQIFLYAALGAFIYLVAWVLPSFFIKSTVPRVLCQVLAVVIAAFFLPAPADPAATYFSGQYAFVGGVVLVGGWSLIQKLRGR